MGLSGLGNGESRITAKPIISTNHTKFYYD
jgi:hypothetical protein